MADKDIKKNIIFSIAVEDNTDWKSFEAKIQHLEKMFEQLNINVKPGRYEIAISEDSVRGAFKPVITAMNNLAKAIGRLYSATNNLVNVFRKMAAVQIAMSPRAQRLTNRLEQIMKKIDKVGDAVNTSAAAAKRVEKAALAITNSAAANNAIKEELVEVSDSIYALVNEFRQKVKYSKVPSTVKGMFEFAGGAIDRLLSGKGLGNLMTESERRGEVTLSPKSSKGLGVAIGAAVGSVIGMVIAPVLDRILSRLSEVSAILASVLDIIRTSLFLILRPIGDFVGLLLMPLARVLLIVAILWLKFLRDPAGFLGEAMKKLREEPYKSGREAKPFWAGVGAALAVLAAAILTVAWEIELGAAIILGAISAVAGAFLGWNFADLLSTIMNVLRGVDSILQQIFGELGAALMALLRLDFRSAAEHLFNALSLIAMIFMNGVKVIMMVIGIIIGILARGAATVGGILLNIFFTGLKVIAGAISIVVGAIIGLINYIINVVINTIFALLNALIDTVKGVVETISSAWNSAVDKATDFIDKVVNAMSKMSAAAKNKITGVINAIKSFVNNVKNSISSAVNKMNSLPQKVLDTIREGMRLAKDKIEGIGQYLYSKLKSIIDTAVSAVTGAKNEAGKLVSKALSIIGVSDLIIHNGIVYKTAPDDTIIATKYPELLGTAGGKSINLTVNVNINGSLVGDERKLAEIVSRAVKDELYRLSRF